MLWIRDIFVRIRFRGSVPLTNGSGSGSRSCYFRPLSSRRQQKLLLKGFPAYRYLLFEGTFTSFFLRWKGIKYSQKSRNQGFSYYFCLMIEGSGSGSRRPKNIRIHNTGFKAPWRMFRRDLEPLFRFHDVLIRIRIRGSVPLYCGSGSRSCFFPQCGGSLDVNINKYRYLPIYQNKLLLHLYPASRITSYLEVTLL